MLTWPFAAHKLVNVLNRTPVSPATPATTPALLMREVSRVRAYLSDIMSHCTPSKRGLEKVSGVRVVRMPSPTIREEWNCPEWLEEMRTLLNHELKRGLLKMLLPLAVG